MNSDTTLKITTSAPEDTSKLGSALGALLKGGEMIELDGDLGTGKTTFTQGLVHKMGFAAEVPSPTFTISRDYPVKDGLTIHHFDFYRLGGADVVSTEMAEFIGDPKAIVLVEWASHGAAQLPDDRIRVKFAYGDNESQRDIAIEPMSPKYQNIIKELKHVFGH